MLSQGAETVSIFMKLSWLPKYPITYVKNIIRMSEIQTTDHYQMLDENSKIKSNRRKFYERRIVIAN